MNLGRSGHGPLLMLIHSATNSSALTDTQRRLFYGNKPRCLQRTIAQNSNAALLMWLNVHRVISFAFFLGSVLAMVSGLFACMTFRSIDINIGRSMASKAFVSTVLGGIGNLAGAVGISKKMSTAASIIFNETMIVEMIDT